MGIYSQGEVTYFTGEFRTAYNFSLPPARGNLVPKISLEYSSSASPSIIGRGWQIPIDHISRSLRHGVPKYLGPSGKDSDDEFEFYLDGYSGPLIFESQTGPNLYLYRARREGIFAKFYYDAKQDTWRVLHPSGKVWILGTPDARDHEGESPDTFAWYAKTITDTDGNQIRFIYKRANGALYPERIEYDLSKVTEVSHRPFVGFVWSDKPQPQQISYKKGFRTVYDAKTLDEIQVGYEELDPKSGIVKVSYPGRKYSLLYGPETAGSSHRNLKSFEPTQLPKTEFDYYGCVTGYENVQKIPHGLSIRDWEHNLEVTRVKQIDNGAEMRTTSMLVDMDGDGVPDLLIVESSKDTPRLKKVNGEHTNKWYWLKNLEGKGWASKLKEIPMPPTKLNETIPIQGAYDPSALRLEKTDGAGITTRRQDVFDINGDGKPDLVWVAGGTVYVLLGTGSGFETDPKEPSKFVIREWTAPNAVKSCGLGRTWRYSVYSYDDAALVDMNGDGLPDYVTSRTNGTPGLEVYLNSGTGFSESPDFIPIDNSKLPRGDIPAGAIRAAEYATNGDYLTRDLRDMNGDGIPDLVECPFNNGLFISYGNGSRFDSSNVLSVANGQISLSLTDPGWTDPTAKGSHIKHTVQGIYDVNGDGLPDIVDIDISTGEYRVSFNMGNSFTPWQKWPVAAVGSEIPRRGLVTVIKDQAKKYYADSDSDYYIGVKRALLDFDGDGQLELVSAPYNYSTLDTSLFFIKYGGDPYSSEFSGKADPYAPGVDHIEGSWIFGNTNPPKGSKYLINTEWYALKAPAKPKHTLKQAKSGNGVTTNLSYGHPETIRSATPFPVWAVTVIDRYDLATDDHRQTYLESYNPQYDHVRKEFRGFQCVLEDQGNLRLLEHDFYQGEFDQGIEHTTSIYAKEEVQAGPQSGTLGDNIGWRSFDLRSPPAPLQIVTRVINTTNYPNQRTWARIEREDDTVYDPGGFNRETSTAYVYDTTHGVVKEIHHSGYPDDKTDERVDKFTYDVLDSPDCYMVKKKRQTREDYQGAKVTETEWRFDDQCTNAASPLTKGRPCSESVWRGAGQPPAVSAFAYDELGRLISTTDPDGHKGTYSYHGQTPNRKTSTNALGHQIIYDEYDVFSGQPGRTCGPQSDSSGNWRCDSTIYDLYGRPTEIHKAVDSSSGGYQMVMVTKIDYKDKGGLFDPTSVTATYYPDQRNDKLLKRIVKVYYDGTGNILKHAHTDKANWSSRYFAYDWFGNLYAAWFPLSESFQTGYDHQKLVDPQKLVIINADYYYYHDLLNRPTSSRGPYGTELTLTYRGKDVWVNDARSYLTKYNLSAFDEIKSIEQTVKGQPLRTEFGYDAAGRLIQATDPDGAVYGYDFYGDGKLHQADLLSGSWIYERTPGGRLDVIKIPDGTLIEHKYDGIGRLKERSLKPGQGLNTEHEPRLETFSYDADSKQIGHLTGVSSNDYKYKMAYDAMSNLTYKKLSKLNSKQSLFYEKSFDALGDVLTVTYPSQRVVSYEYDNAGRLWKITDSGLGKLSATMEYYIDGNLKSITGDMYPSLNWSRTYYYDAKHRLDGIDSNIKGISWKLGYDYDQNNNIRHLNDDLRGLKYTWFYDEINRLYEAQGYSTGPFKYTYNKNSSLATVEDNGETFTYTYTDQRNSLLKSIGSKSETTNFTHDSKTGQRCTASRLGSQTLKYTWTGDGRLASMEQLGGIKPSITKYSYDHTGTRWQRIHDKVTNLFLDELVELEDDGRSNNTREYLYLPGLICTLPGSQTGEVAFKDIMNVAVVFDDHGQLTHSTSYTPYGKKIPITDSAASGGMRFDFNGKRREIKQDLLYYGARYFDPVSQQWLSVDPMHIVGDSEVSINNFLQPFIYANSNPTTFIDKLGLQPGEAEDSTEETTVKSPKASDTKKVNIPAFDSFTKFSISNLIKLIKLFSPIGYKVEVIFINANYGRADEIVGHAALITENLLTGKKESLSWGGSFSQSDLKGRYLFSGRSLWVYTYSLSESEGRSIEIAVKQARDQNVWPCSLAVKYALRGSKAFSNAEPWFSSTLFGPAGVSRLLDYMNLKGTFKYQSKEFWQ